ncbi:competence/damage-inducible protein A [Marinilongibacter aquaticus]|uniref:competence/damage-inducible protein A n=1 Tax=Marinilongibacter aquaticus TaxID=2975157 RepID=UPI0021BDCD6B|nr:competence/damage-inducible protein A [Marinilongibacter aquaticus]UBM59117.1 competence/damage-inducible protein A [Marinilongibacter aquaticus]
MKEIRAEVITIGDEILYGQITDTNTQWMSAELDKLGIRTVRKSSIGDSEEAILGILEEGLGRADILLITGGLGPTKDDITKKTLAQFFGDHLELNNDALEMVEGFFTQRGRTLTEINKQQAFLPSQCTYLPNAVGTAPGMWFDAEGKVIVSMPGVPFEMKYLMSEEVLPRLREKFKTPFIVHRIIRTVGIGESYLSEMIEAWELALPSHIKLAYLPNLSQVRLRLTGVGFDKDLLEKEIDLEVEKLREIAGQYIFGEGDDELESVIAQTLTARQETLSLAESCTGGFLAHSITALAGSSAYFLGGVVSYSNAVKINQLGVQAETIEAHGAVSEETVIQMAEGVKKLIGSTYSIATSGIAGPGGGTPEKPVGTIWIAVSGPNKTLAKKILSTKTRLLNIEYGSKVALNMLRKMIIEEN